MRSLTLAGALLALLSGWALAHDDTGPQDDARALLGLIGQHYAYPERIDESRLAPFADPARLAAITSEYGLLQYAECVLHTLEDHHAIMGVSSAVSFGLVPSYTDLWVVHEEGHYRIADVRSGSPAAHAGIEPGLQLVALGGEAVEEAVSHLCGGPFTTDEGRGFAARVLVAGPRDRSRVLTVREDDGQVRTVELPNLYEHGVSRPDGPVRALLREDGVLVLRVHDSLSDDGFVVAVDAALEQAGSAGVVIDLRDTPSGGNTVNARGLLGRFVDQARPYQRHHLTAEGRSTGVERQWIEEVLPRGDTLAHVPVAVLVGRWTGSMGEGLAMGFHHAVGAEIVGAPMAGLLGAVYDFTLSHTGWTVKLPAERMSHVDGTPREAFRPSTLLESAEVLPGMEGDPALEAAVQSLRAQPR